MKKIIVAILSFVLLIGARPLTEVADDVVKAKNDINAAILARGGNGVGGLTNAAQRIINIPLPQLQFEQTYIAWSNATRTVQYAVTNELSEVSYISFQAQCPEPYETNIVGEVQNKLIINDAIQYMYEKMSQGN